MNGNTAASVGGSSSSSIGNTAAASPSTASLHSSSNRASLRRARSQDEDDDHSDSDGCLLLPLDETGPLEEQAPPSNASLDAGMAAIRRWIRSQPGEDFATNNTRNADTDLLDTTPQRQRSLSEPDGSRLRQFFFQQAMAPSGFRRRRARTLRDSNAMLELTERTTSDSPATGPASTSASASSNTDVAGVSQSQAQPAPAQASTQPVASSVSSTDSQPQASLTATVANADTATTQQQQLQQSLDLDREARTRWIRINRRFQLIITVVALIFSLLLFAILVCWVVLTSSYVISIDKTCDVPLKTYYWLVTLQLVLDVFRTDIMRFVFRWDAANNSNQRIPCRVIVYNVCYLTYAFLVLRLGVRSVFTDHSSCSRTAPELFRTSAVFVSLAIAAWSTIILGYLVPFCFVATLLTWNGYTPAAPVNARDRTLRGVFPAAYATQAAPPGCVDQMRVVSVEHVSIQDCCICMEDFSPGEVIVETDCRHCFHKQCCREWLRQARTCPVCRTDLVDGTNGSSHAVHSTTAGTTMDATSAPPPSSATTASSSSRTLSPFHGRLVREDFSEVVSLLQILRNQESITQERPTANATLAINDDLVDTEEGRPTRHYSL